MKKFLIFTTLFLMAFSSFQINASSSASSQKTDNSEKITGLINELSGNLPKSQIQLKDFKIFDMENKSHQLFDYKGKVILLNFWATWCPPCRAEMPSMEKLSNEYKNKNFTVLAVSAEDFKTVKNFITTNKYTFPVFTDDNGQLNNAYGTGSIPTTYLIDKNGNMIAQFVGSREWDSQTAKDLINNLLK